MAVIIVTLVLAVILVNVGQNLLMKLTGADVMFFSIRSKLIAYFLVWFLLLGVILA